jgi:hypothetical protein
MNRIISVLAMALAGWTVLFTVSYLAWRLSGHG